jgi:hypothetical protein
MKVAFRTSALLITGLLWSQPLFAQIRTLDRELSTKTLAPIATSTLSALGGSAILANVVIRANVDNVHVYSNGVIGGPGELVMTSPKRTTGEPASRLVVQSEGPMPAGPYSVSIAFTHAKGGDAVQITDINTGAVLTTCTLTQLPNYNDTQACTAGVQLSGAKLQILAVPTVGYQLYPTQITVSQLR